MPTSHLLWIILVVVNLLIQVLCFFRDENRPLYRAKKITTPLLLFSAFMLLWHDSDSTFSVASIILLAMGIGEIGIEGSNVVSSQNPPPTVAEKWAVTLAGLLFLAVNVFLGAALLARVSTALPIVVGFGAAAAGVASLLVLTFRFFAPEKSVRTQMLIYGPGLVVLAAGAIAALFGPVTGLGIAAVLLTVSDSLVLIRMGAGLDKGIAREKSILLMLLISILLLYYVYMGVLISTGSPFSS